MTPTRRRAASAALAPAMLAALSLVPARAQTPPAQTPPAQTSTAPATPPSAGGTPERIPFGLPYGAPLPLAQSERLVAAAQAEAERRGWPMNIALVDPAGDLLVFRRMDGAQLVSVGIAQRKARTAARWRRETRVFFNGYAAGATYYGTLDPELAPSPGGFPIVLDGRVVGGIGCSGGTGDQDSVVCKAGLDALADKP